MAAEGFWRPLAERRYDEGWPLYESRRRPPYVIPPLTDRPEWRGEDPAGMRIAVLVEQGFGDVIMFGRFLSELTRRGATAVIGSDARHLSRLFEAQGYEARHFFADKPLVACDAWTYFGSLPYRLGSIPPTPPAYLSAAATGSGGIGVMAETRPGAFNAENKALPEALAPRLLALGRDLSPTATGAMDFLDTAGIVAGLDLVISVDTAVVHLAGALGVPCWTLLPQVGMDWRWNDGVRSDWYPEMRLFRQPSPGDWSAVLDAIESALAAH